MADKDNDKEPQKVRLTGILWSTKLVLDIIRNLLIIIVMIAILVAIIILIPKVSEQLKTFGELQSSMNDKLGSLGSDIGSSDKSNSNYDPNNNNNQITDYNKQTTNNQPSNTNDGSKTSLSEKLGDLPVQLQDAAKTNNWDEAAKLLDIMETKIPPNSPEYSSVADKFQLLDQAILNKDALLVEKIINS